MIHTIATTISSSMFIYTITIITITITVTVTVTIIIITIHTITMTLIITRRGTTSTAGRRTSAAHYSIAGSNSNA